MIEFSIYSNLNFDMNEKERLDAQTVRIYAAVCFIHDALFGPRIIGV